MVACPVCKDELTSQQEQHGRHFVECLRCGPYSLSQEANEDLAGLMGKYQNSNLLLSHAICKMTKGRSDWPMLTSEGVESILQNTELPGLSGQLDNLILWLAESQPSPGEGAPIGHKTEAAVGVLNQASLGFICEHAINSRLIDGMVRQFQEGAYAFGPLKLTFNGWQHYEELQRGNSASRVAFMAMQFGDPQLDAIYRDHFKDAVGATGFFLKRLDEGQPAGLIDDRLRVEIRQSRFLIADLTHHNKGAYWEAGYAEGLGKQVIYTCRKDAFNAEGTHFDTNHHLTVMWDPDNLGEALEKLKATIRATLPGESKLSD